jgi:hypothetical protein
MKCQRVVFLTATKCHLNNNCVHCSEWGRQRDGHDKMCQPHGRDTLKIWVTHLVKVTCLFISLFIHSFVNCLLNSYSIYWKVAYCSVIWKEIEASDRAFIWCTVSAVAEREWVKSWKILGYQTFVPAFEPGMSRVEIRRFTVAGTSFGAGQQTLRLLWNAEFHCRVRNSARLTLLCMSHKTEIHPFTSYFLITNVNIVPPSSFNFSSSIFLSGLPPTKFLYVFSFSHGHATWPTHIILDALSIITVANLPTLQNNFTVNKCT